MIRKSMNRACRDLALNLVLLAGASAGFTQTPQQHIVGSADWKTRAVTPTEINHRIEDAAVTYSAHAPVSRVAFYDIAYPKDDSEYSELDGDAVLLVTSLSQEQSELPLKRVFVAYEGKEIELKLISSVLSKETKSDSLTAKTFGPYRVDSIYLLPVFLAIKEADLLIDYAKNRVGFKLATFSSEVPSEVRALPIGTPTGSGPSMAALINLLQREYPGFVKKD